MISTGRTKIVQQLRHLLEVAADDQSAALARFRGLVDVHGRTQVGPALAMLLEEHLALTGQRSPAVQDPFGASSADADGECGTTRPVIP